MIIDDLITDRTQGDVDTVINLDAIGWDNMSAAQQTAWALATLKGAYNASDLNRVGQAVIYLQTTLNGIQTALDAALALYGVAPDANFHITWTPTSVTMKTDWADTDTPTPTQMADYLDGVDTVTACITITRNLPTSMDNLSYSKANAIEDTIRREYNAALQFQADRLAKIELASQVWPYSDEYNSGNAFYIKTCPKRYQRVEYLISTKGITIDGTKLTNNSEIRARVYRPSGAVAQYIYQADSGSSLTTNFTAYTAAGGSATGYWRFGNRYLSLAVATGAWHETRQNKSGVWIDGTSVGTYSSVSAFTTSNSLTIHGTAASANMRIAWIERYENGVFAASYLPVRDLVTNELGYLDTSDGTFYTNDSATITAGGDI